jgi:outer membrane lipoprotein-sorting protein
MFLMGCSNQQLSQCKNEDHQLKKYLEDVKKYNKNKKPIKIILLRSEEIKKFMYAFNNSSPKTNFNNIKLIIIFDRKEWKFVGLTLVDKNKCVAGYTQVFREQLAKWKKGIITSKGVKI